jgi:hypothetical protein
MQQQKFTQEQTTGNSANNKCIAFFGLFATQGSSYDRSRVRHCCEKSSSRFFTELQLSS